ncbi:MAG: hypothetical protein JW840_03160 [Candidatus Thermoplasmatota archaeon]|nr:hypothetical protein [Candidatus Thermoplasmatota archaeon]
MAKTIALKLKREEEYIIAQFNKQGITNSELLRNALRFYFTHLHTLTQDDQSKNIFIRNDPARSDFSVSFFELKQELQQLREQMKETQRSVQNTVATLQRRLYLLSVNDPRSHQLPLPIKFDIIYDIHQQVDDFLKTRSTEQVPREIV